MIRNTILLLLPLLAAFNSLYAANRAGTSAAVFLKLADDARAKGLAGSTVALPAAWQKGWAGPGNLLVNPAGLAGALKASYAFSSERRFADIQHGMLHLSRPWNERLNIAGYCSWIQVPDQEITTLEQPDGTGMNYDYADFAAGLSAGLRLTDRLSAGSSLRIVRQELHNEHATALAADLGLLLDTGWRRLQIGMAAANFGNRMQLEGEDLLIEAEDGRPARLDTEEFQLPLSFRVGLSDELWSVSRQSLQGSVQALHVNDNGESLSAGLEYSFDQALFLRAGHYVGKDLERWSAGMGLRLRIPGSALQLQLDYAYTALEYFPGLQQFSLSLLP